MRRIALAFLLVGFFSVGTQAAGDVAVVGGLDFGFKKLHLDATNSSGGSGTVFSPTFTTLNPTLAFSYGPFYTILSYDKSISSDSETGDSAVVLGGTTFPTAKTLEFGRTDTTITLGYRLTKSFNLFAGYADDVNKFSQTQAAAFLIVTDITYTEKGPFAGASYAMTFGDKGTLGLSVGYAKLDSELKFETHPTLGAQPGSTQGDNKGLSYGLTWSGTLTGSLGYRIGAKETRYEMKQPGQITERYTSFFIGVTNYF